MRKRPSIKLEHKPEPESAVTTVSRDNGMTVSEGELKVGRDYVKNSLYLHPRVQKRLRALAFHEEKKIHDLLVEALDKLLADRGQPAIRELEQGE